MVAEGRHQQVVLLRRDILATVVGIERHPIPWRAKAKLPGPTNQCERADVLCSATLSVRRGSEQGNSVTRTWRQPLVFEPMWRDTVPARPSRTGAASTLHHSKNPVPLMLCSPENHLLWNPPSGCTVETAWVADERVASIALVHAAAPRAAARGPSPNPATRPIKRRSNTPLKIPDFVFQAKVPSFQRAF